MNVRDAGFLVARGLAILFLVRSCLYALGALMVLARSWPDVGMFVRDAYWAYALVEFLAAGVLWRGAMHFGEGIEPRPLEPPVDMGQAFRILLFGLSLYFF